MEYHVPVMLNECLEGLHIRPDGIYVDVTFGGGGHSRAIIQHLNTKGHLFSFGQDLDAYENAKCVPTTPSLIDDPRWSFVHANFRYLRNFMDYHGVTEIDGLLADLGVSFHHFDEAERGFSFRFDVPLDMRMNQDAELSAYEVINFYPEKELERIIM